MNVLKFRLLEMTMKRNIMMKGFISFTAADESEHLRLESEFLTAATNGDTETVAQMVR